MDQGFSFTIGGPAGTGVRLAGLTLAKIGSRTGFASHGYTEYPSLIRGGHNVMKVTLREDRVWGPAPYVDLLVALDAETIPLHVEELRGEAGVLFDTEYVQDPKLPEGVKGFGVPMMDIVRDNDGRSVMRNVVMLGASLALLDGPMEELFAMIEEELGRKGDDIVNLNKKIAQAGYDYIREHYGEWKQVLQPKGEVRNQILLTGNEAIALGAIAAGVQFASVYPMTPTSDILNVLVGYQEKFGVVCVQPEDEIAGANMAIGASHAGARSMVATAGGGFCLMSEAYGLAGITEVPLVMIVGMRGAPATGLPTWTEQADLRFVLHASQGDFPRIVLAPGDVEEAFHMTMQAFNLAEKYQTPVVVLADKMILESHERVRAFEYDEYEVDRGKLVWSEEEVMAKYKDLYSDGYRRYVVTDDGISPRAVPGAGLHFVANSDEHSPEGYSEESSENRIAQMDKRMKKLVMCEKEEMESPELFGPAEAKVTVVGWGSTKGTALEAMKLLPEGEMNYLHITWMNPFPAEAVKHFLQDAKYTLLVEGNYTGQLGGLIREKTGVNILDWLLKYDGRPIYAHELVEKVKFILKGER